MTTTTPTTINLARRVLEHAESSARIEASTGVTLARAVLAYDRLFRHEHDEACPVLSGPDGPDKLCECGFGERYRDLHATVARLTADLDHMRKYVAHNDEEYKIMKDVLRAEHAACQEMRATVARLTGDAGGRNAELADEYNTKLAALNERGIVRGQDVRRGDPFGALVSAYDTLTAQRDRLRSALKELAEWAMTSVQCETQHADYRDDPEWQRAERAARLAADGSE